MARDPRYDILFEPVRIGPLTARNRFYQVPHCNGFGYRDPSALAMLRRIKAEGGWAVVSTEQVEIHHTSEITPFIELRLWEEKDIPMLAHIADAIHDGGGLAAIELCYNGMNGPNLMSRAVPMGPAHLPIATFYADPVQARRMDLADIADLRRWHRVAVERARRAGFDIIYVYAAHGFGCMHHFLSRRYNDRTDEYGGSLANRARLLREITEDTKEAAGPDAAVAVRLTLDELVGEPGFTIEEARDVIGLMAELPDLWDLALGSWEEDSKTSRFGPEGAQEPFLAGIKQITTKPVVGVGRFTTPDTMARLVRQGVLDFIGAARPSIADPFLPRKIEEGRLDDIRECIGCNICVSGDFTQSPIRCTQNPSMGEEWRKGWHPERHRPRQSAARILVVGAGPAGLECAQALGKRGYEVALAEARRDLGGRVMLEAKLPGLSAWARVRDWRLLQLEKLGNVEIYRESLLAADDVLGMGFQRAVLATGATWRRDGVARFHTRPIPVAKAVFTPDDLMASRLPDAAEVLLYDDDHYYMGGVLAELLVKAGRQVTLMTPAPEVSTWTRATMEQAAIQRRLLELGVTLRTAEALTAWDGAEAEVACAYTGRRSRRAAPALVLVTARLPNEALGLELAQRRAEWQDAGLASVTAIGDALAPGTIAMATYAGRRYSEELDLPPRPDDRPDFRREIAELLPFV